MFGLSVAVSIACVLAVYIGATVQASIGIGIGMIASPVLAFADSDFIPAAIVMSVLPLTFAVAWVDRTHIEPRGVGFALVGRVPGVIAGALIVAALSDRAIALMVAGSVLFAVFVSIITKRFRPTDGSLLVAGLASGFSGTTTGVGGPPMALTYQHSDPATMLSTISAFFCVGSLMSIGALAVVGQIGVRQWQLAAMLLPGVGLGVMTARLIQHRLNPSTVRPAVLAVCTIASIALIIESS